MKIKKIIPLFGIASLSSIITPLALSSCGNSGWVDLTNIYYPKMDRVSNIRQGEIIDRYEDGAYCKNYYFDKVSQNTNIYKQDFYYGHSMHIKAINDVYGADVQIAKAKIYDITCTNSSKTYNWIPVEGTEIVLPIWTMSFTAEFEVVLNNPSSYLEMSNLVSVTNKGKFTVENMPMWLEYVDSGYAYANGFTPEFFVFQLYQESAESQELADSFGWSIHQETTTSLTRIIPNTDISYTMDEEVDFIADDKATLNRLAASKELIAGVDDICSSWYMSNLDETGRS